MTLFIKKFQYKRVIHPLGASNCYQHLWLFQICLYRLLGWMTKCAVRWDTCVPWKQQLVRGSMPIPGFPTKWPCQYQLTHILESRPHFPLRIVLKLNQNSADSCSEDVCNQIRNMSKSNLLFKYLLKWKCRSFYRYLVKYFYPLVQVFS